MSGTVSIYESVEPVGYNTFDWIKVVVLPRINRDENNTRYIFPDPLPDLQEFSEAHSWYKHLRDAPGTFFPMLRIGPEPKGIISTAQQQAAPEGALHWAFITEESLFMESIFPNGYYITKQPWSIMQDCSFHLSHDFSQFFLGNECCHEEKKNSRFYGQTVLLKCNIICDRITRILLQIDPNPPTQPFLIYDAARSRYRKDEETVGVFEKNVNLTIVAGRKYRQHFSNDITWNQHIRANSTFFKI